MTVASIMRCKVVTAEINDSLSTICEIFENVKFHHIFIVNNRNLIGVISDRNFPAEKERDVATMNKKAYEIMSRVAVTVEAKTSIKKASNLMLENNISYILVVSSVGVIEGILSWREIFKFYLKKHQ
jgi:acetoin utilization protein AcuB